MAIAVAGTVTLVAYRRLRLGAAGPSAVVHVVAASSNLPAGATLTEKDVTLVDWHSDMPPAGAFTKLDDVIGRPIINSVVTNELILSGKLAAEGSGIGLTTKIPAGMRATAVRSNEIVGVAGFLYPGSHVDVLATYNPPGSNAPVTTTVLQDVEVLTAGQTIEPDPQGKPQTVNVVTLLLSPDDSQKLLLISTQGTIQFVLRSGIDQKKEEVVPTRLDQLLPSAKPPVVVASGPKRAPQKIAPPSPQPPPAFVLEVIQGTQRSTEKF